jgi:hypothetical protein
MIVRETHVFAATAELTIPLPPAPEKRNPALTSEIKANPLAF